jgi:hypothetical protein
VGLPPGLTRLGDEIVAAARRTRDRHARRRRFATAVLAGALAFAALTPASLDPSHRELTLATDGYAPRGCDLARGTQATLVACEGPMVLHRPYAIN